MRERIVAALRDALGTDDATRIATLRLLSAALKDREAAPLDDSGATGSDEAEGVAVLQQMLRLREGSMRDHEESGRLDLAAREAAEIAVIREFLPPPLTPAEIDAAIAAAIDETHAASLRDLSRVMGALKARFPGRIDGARVGARVKAALGGAPG
jgi:uncharacterized protein YqeY